MKGVLQEILLAEKDPNDIELILEELARHRMGSKIVVARDGAEVMDYLNAQGRFAWRQEGNPSAILLDLIMPKLDGLEVLKKVQADPRLRMIPVLVLTSSAQERDIAERFNLGAGGFALKAVDFQEIIPALRELGLIEILNVPPGSSRGEGDNRVGVTFQDDRGVWH